MQTERGKCEAFLPSWNEMSNVTKPGLEQALPEAQSPLLSSLSRPSPHSAAQCDSFEVLSKHLLGSFSKKPELKAVKNKRLC